MTLGDIARQYFKSDITAAEQALKSSMYAPQEIDKVNGYDPALVAQFMQKYAASNPELTSNEPATVKDVIYRYAVAGDAAAQMAIIADAAPKLTPEMNKWIAEWKRMILVPRRMGALPPGYRDIGCFLVKMGLGD